jgi:hypothetical protein
MLRFAILSSYYWVELLLGRVFIAHKRQMISNPLEPTSGSGLSPR